MSWKQQMGLLALISFHHCETSLSCYKISQQSLQIADKPNISIGKQFILLKEKGLESSSPFHQIAQIPAQTSFA
ncbi:hypothetical protein D0872_15310 [Bacillus velezensis]|nr:hypothetical protein BUE72_14620 [Bacillus amyloliquefaciens]PQB12291.1 hypothetical protein C5O26_06515 [Bacillus velezensis]THC35565.1 hypothetical protein D0872_15310 [Bacillus velezensis]